MARHLSPKTVAVLSLIAEGLSYNQIVDGHPNITYLDIFHAAEEALRVNESDSDHTTRLAAIKKKHPRAYEKWTEDEDAQLRSMIGRRMRIRDIAAHFQRQPSAINSRLGKLGLDYKKLPVAIDPRT